MKNIFTILKKELLTEFRLQYSFYGVLLYVASSTFVLFLAISQPEKNVWVALYWIILLFACINAVAKSFLQESRGRMLYYYTLVHPSHFIAAKLIFNTLLMLIICVLNLLLVNLFLGSPVVQLKVFAATTLLGSTSFALLFTLLSALAAKAQQNAAMVAILGFPLVIPMLFILIRLTISSTNFNDETPWLYLVVLAGYNLLLVMLSLILYPFLWKE